jgi:methionyl-tRNA formyltransferase
MRILVSGQKEVGRAVFELCRKEGHEVVAVSAPAWASSRTTAGDRLPDRLSFAAEMDGVERIPADSLRAELVPKGTDLIVAAHSHAFISRKTRNRAFWDAIGFHPSLLPLHRGRDAVRWTLHLKEPVTGASVYWLTDTVDGGLRSQRRPMHSSGPEIRQENCGARFSHRWDCDCSSACLPTSAREDKSL